ncbi:hypothetical protein Syun_003537 [Stephania yunnanensis]|uniref:Uncharacterized protein n=1 Tax=Stephania yunnanensis TaxID=152371 RepID=A0AAP0L2C6_9MAGN
MATYQKTCNSETFNQAWLLECAIKSGAKNYAKSKENVNVDTVRNVEVNVDTPVDNYWYETTQGLEVLQIESGISIAQNDDDKAVIEIGVISERPEEPQIESKED